MQWYRHFWHRSVQHVSSTGNLMDRGYMIDLQYLFSPTYVRLMVARIGRVCRAYNYRILGGGSTHVQDVREHKDFFFCMFFFSPQGEKEHT